MIRDNISGQKKCDNAYQINSGDGSGAGRRRGKLIGPRLISAAKSLKEKNPWIKTGPN